MQRKIGRGRAKGKWKLLGEIKNFSEILNSTAIKGAADSPLAVGCMGPLETAFFAVLLAVLFHHQRVCGE